MAEPRILLNDLAIGESPRWHDGRLWFAHWIAQEVVAVDDEGVSEVILRVPFETIPFSIDWLPDGDLLIASGSDRPLLRRRADGSLVAHGAVERGCNEIVVDGRGNAYLNGVGFDIMAGAPFAPGGITLVTPDGRTRRVARGSHSPTEWP